MKAKLLLFIILLLPGVQVLAHAIWIETNQKGVKGKQQEVSIFFGEYADNERDSVAKWFSNLRDMQLFLTAPDGAKTKLDLRAVVDHYAAAFTPGSEGVYTLSVSHTVADIYGETKIEYYAVASVFVNSTDTRSLPATTLLAIQPGAETTNNKPVSVNVYNNQTLLPGAKVVIASPAGWERTLYTNQQGAVSFTPLVTGRHMLEAVRVDKTPGTHGGKAYKSVTHLVTYCIDVKP
jgi:uncharacterized GH25 family protein